MDDVNDNANGDNVGSTIFNAIARHQPHRFAPGVSDNANNFADCTDETLVNYGGSVTGADNDISGSLPLPIIAGDVFNILITLDLDEVKDPVANAKFGIATDSTYKYNHANNNYHKYILQLNVVSDSTSDALPKYV